MTDNIYNAAMDDTSNVGTVDTSSGDNVSRDTADSRDVAVNSRDGSGNTTGDNAADHTLGDNGSSVNRVGYTDGKRDAKNGLISLADRTTDEQRRIAQMGGRASGETRRKKKHMREIAAALLAHQMSDAQVSDILGTAAELLDGDTTVAAVLTARLAQDAASGNVRAYETLRDTAGYKPIEQMQVDTVITDAERDMIDRVASRVVNK